jgi:hypothetical protein
LGGLPSYEILDRLGAALDILLQRGSVITNLYRLTYLDAVSTVISHEHGHRH